MEPNDFVLVPNGFGYEYRYNFRLDEDIIPRCIYQPSIGVRTLLFQLRTSFILRTTEGEEVLGSERLYAVGSENATNSLFTIKWLGRLVEYWFPPAAARQMFRDALAFATEVAAQDVVPVVVEFHVYTVQQPGEEAAAAADRAIRPERLVPIYVSAGDAYLLDRAREGRLPIDDSRVAYFLMMNKTRVQNDVEGLNLMNVCRICQRGPVLGSQIARLRCHHAFHYHCIVNFLLNRDFCPSCAPENEGGNNNDDGNDDGGDNEKRKRENDDGCHNEKSKRENDDGGGRRENDDGGDNGKGIDNVV